MPIEFTLFTQELEKFDPALWREKYKITKKDKIYIQNLLSEKRYEEAIDFYIDKYLKRMNKEYTAVLRYNMLPATQHILGRSDLNTIDRNVTDSTQAYTSTSGTIMGFIVRTYLQDKAYDYLFKKKEEDQPPILPKDVIGIMRDKAEKEFRRYTADALARTREDVLTDVRRIQLDIVRQERVWDKLIEDKKEFNAESEIRKFKQEMKVKYESYLKKMNGKIIESREFTKADGTVVTRHYDLDYYSDMSVRTTMLNMDRTAEETIAMLDDDDVVEYYKRDSRTIKHDPREICQTILKTKIKGKSLLALNQKAATRLQIMTVAEAKSLDAMGVNCRHSVKRVSRAFLKSIQPKEKKAS